MGIDLELADCAAALYRLRECQDSGPCDHRPGCEEQLDRLYARAAAERPGQGAEFGHRRFADINETMRLTGMGFPADPVPHDDYDGFRTQTVDGRSGIPSFKLLSNDRWLVTAREIDEALAAYTEVSPARRAELETDPKWSAWIAWLEVARRHGGFEAE